MATGRRPKLLTENLFGQQLQASGPPVFRIFAEFPVKTLGAT